MGLLLLIIYILIFVFQIKFLIKLIKNNKAFYPIIITEIVSIIIAIGVLKYFDSLPGTGLMPGLTYIAEYIFSLGAGIIYYIMLVISICAKILATEKNKKHQGKKYNYPFAIISIILIIIIFMFLGITMILPNILY